MANTSSSGPDAVKRSIEPDDEGQCESDVKKVKVMTSDAVEDTLQPIKGEKSSKKDIENPSQSENGKSKSAVKRPGEVISEDTQCLNSPKKRKVINDQEQHVDGNEEIEKRKKRIKNKALLKTIMEQMEFYFSDSNLSKDRYLRKLYDETEDGYIDLEVFNNFNKLQSLLKGELSLTILSKALKKSKLLEMNDDHTKVRRRTPLKEIDPEEVNRRTVYVEHLPSHASHAWIKKIFSKCGKVCYVSLPVYQSSKDIKGFAFVEFGSAEEAEKACSMLNNPPPSKTEEKPGKFPKGNKFLYRAQKVVPSVKVEEPDSNEENLQSDSKEDQLISPTKKKKKKNTKRKAEETVEKISTSEQTDMHDEKKKKKKKRKRQNTVEERGEVKQKMTSDTKIPIIEENKKSEAPSSSATNTVAEDKKEEMQKNIEIKSDSTTTKKKKKRKKSKKSYDQNEILDTHMSTEEETKISTKIIETEKDQGEGIEVDTSNSEVKLSRKERKRLRQEDIRKKKAERKEKRLEEGQDVQDQSEPDPKETTTVNKSETPQDTDSGRRRIDSVVSESSETDENTKIYRKSDGSQVTSCLVKSKKQDVVKKVEFDPVPVTTEFVERKEVRRRKKQKRESLHLRVISKKDWLSLREDYINKQKTHMAALKESLRELRMQEGTIPPPQENNGKKHVDLTNVFGTKRLKPSQDVKLAHLEELKFIPDVIVQWKCTHEINRNKIKTMFKKIPSDRIAYIEGKEEAKSGYIRFKDGSSAKEFAKLSRTSDSFSARVLPKSQQAAYWEKANQDRVAKLSRKKNERGSDRIARKVFEKNKATFHEKGSHIVFDNDDDEDNDDRNFSNPYMAAIAKENQHDLEESFLAIFRK